MQTAFFAISGVLPEEKAMEMIELAVEDTYGEKGEAVVEHELRAADLARERIHAGPAAEESYQRDWHMRPPVPADAPEFVRKVTAEMIA